MLREILDTVWTLMLLYTFEMYDFHAFWSNISILIVISMPMRVVSCGARYFVKCYFSIVSKTLRHSVHFGVDGTVINAVYITMVESSRAVLVT